MQPMARPFQVLFISAFFQSCSGVVPVVSEQRTSFVPVGSACSVVPACVLVTAQPTSLLLNPLNSVGFDAAPVWAARVLAWINRDLERGARHQWKTKRLMNVGRKKACGQMSGKHSDGVSAFGLLAPCTLAVRLFRCALS